MGETNIKMALFRIRGHYITYYDGYLEANTEEEARIKAQKDSGWIDLDSKLINRPLVDYVIKIQQRRPFINFSKTSSQY